MDAMPETNVLSAEERAFLAQVKARILELHPEAEIIASRAHGIFEDYADWTVTVVTEQKLPWQEELPISKTIGRLEIETGQSVVEYVYSRAELESLAETPFVLDLMRGGTEI